MALHFKPYTLTPVATSGKRFADFRPFVPAINDEGVLAFQATLCDGHSGVFTSDGRSIADRAVSASSACPARHFSSHPDINRAGALAVYGTLKSGGEAVLLLPPDGSLVQTPSRGRLGGVGPLGPTMNEHGDIAIRATLHGGAACVGVLRGDRFDPVAQVDEMFCGFEGLPVINDVGQLVFRANLPGDRQGVFVQQGALCASIAVTGGEFKEIARFPAIDGQGNVAFAARRGSGAWGVFSVSSGRLACVVDADPGFESLRGVLINNAGPVAFLATPAGGQLGLYTGTDPVRHRLLGLGDPLSGSTVVDFALNPVSVNERGQMAVRVALADRQQLILRADPQG